jgi:hypothetical protein
VGRYTFNGHAVHRSREESVLSARPISDPPPEPRSQTPAGPTDAVAPGDGSSDHDRRTALLSAVARIAEGFVRAEDWRDAVPDALAELGEAAGVGRVYVFENHFGSDDQLLHSLRFEWVADGVAGFLDDASMRDRPYKAKSGPGWFDEVAVGRTVCASTSDEPDPMSRATMEQWGIVSIAVVPIHVDGAWWGYVAYDDVVEARPWTAGELDALRTAAGLMAAAIERRRDRLQRHAASEKYRALVEQVPSVVYAEYLDGPDGDELGESYMSPQVTSRSGTRRRSGSTSGSSGTTSCTRTTSRACVSSRIAPSSSASRGMSSTASAPRTVGSAGCWTKPRCSRTRRAGPSCGRES